MISERVKLLQEKMLENNIDIYVIPTSDYHMSEYVCEYFQFRKWLSGFTGSAGTMVVTKENAYLWTDGRYFIQANRQLEGSGIKLMRMGNANVPTINEFLLEKLTEGMTLGFDGKCLSTLEARAFEKIVEEKKARLVVDVDLSEIYQPRPSLPIDKLWILDEKYAGESTSSKLAKVREAMKKQKVSYHLLCALDEIAWLFNFRGNDILHTPAVLSYALIGLDSVTLYINPRKLEDETKKELEKNITEFKDYLEIYNDVKRINGQVMLDCHKVNYLLYSLLKDKAVLADDPEILLKAMKNPVEIENLRQAHILDGVAVTKFIYWLKKTVKEREISEWDASEYLDNLRRNIPSNLGLSFDSIGAYNANGAMMHYSATKESAAILKPMGMYLIDSGGQYYQGTTDITRTIVLGEMKPEWIRDYTLTLKGLIRLSRQKFLYGCKGINLDILARGELWNIGLDYKCGTGHGVGYLLGVHEAPNGFRWKVVPERNDSCILEEGMVTTIEPGVYVENSHGIRIENELVCHRDMENEYGQFMNFETITFAPIDLLGIDKKLLDDSEIEFLNNYHQKVYEKISPYLNEEEKNWLKEETRAI